MWIIQEVVYICWAREGRHCMYVGRMDSSLGQSDQDVAAWKPMGPSSCRVRTLPIPFGSSIGLWSKPSITFLWLSTTCSRSCRLASWQDGAWNTSLDGLRFRLRPIQVQGPEGYGLWLPRLDDCRRRKHERSFLITARPVASKVY